MKERHRGDGPITNYVRSTNSPHGYSSVHEITTPIINVLIHCEGIRRLGSDKGKSLLVTSDFRELYHTFNLGYCYRRTD